MRIMIMKHTKHSPVCVWKILISLLHASCQKKSSLNFALGVKILREECIHTSSKIRGIVLHTLIFYFQKLISKPMLSKRKTRITYSCINGDKIVYLNLKNIYLLGAFSIKH